MRGERLDCWLMELTLRAGYEGDVGVLSSVRGGRGGCTLHGLERKHDEVGQRRLQWNRIMAGKRGGGRSSQFHFYNPLGWWACKEKGG